jgi:hypothetical protein
MDADFPAAHSMDTVWFAVDADGHVGYFTTGEGGAVPVSADLPEPHDAYEVRDRLEECLPSGEARYDLQGFVPPGPRRERRRHQPELSRSQGVLFLKALAPARQQKLLADRHLIPACADLAVIFGPLPEDLFRLLHTGRHCLGCFDLSDFDARWEMIAERGVYCYGHPTYYYGDRAEDAIAGPYGRTMVPHAPVHLDQLPPGLRKVIAGTPFKGLRFAETVHIQPCELGPVVCELNVAYLTRDGGTILPIDGTDPDDYRKFHEWLTGEERDWLQGISVEPPGQGAARG